MSGTDERAPSRVVAERYRLERVLGRGGMGVVWLAVDTLIERRVALKELRAPEGDEASFVERALREARSAGRLSHPGVVGVHDVIAPAGENDPVYIVMEYVQAPTLGEVLDQQGPLPASRVAAMGLGILDALMAAHAMGIVHRDVKPANVLVGEGDRVKLTDFGIALAAEDTRLTRSGVIGTQGYLAPECFDAGEVGPATDLWALGATLFHAVAGQAPFERDTPSATLRAILFDDLPAPPCEPALAEVISGLLTRPTAQRLTADTARQLLQQAATAPAVDPTPTGGAGQSGWEAQATTLQRHRPAPRPAQPIPPPPQPPSPAGSTNKPPWMIVLGLAAIVLLVAAVIILTNNNDDGGGGATPDSPTGSPEDTARRFVTAFLTHDCASQADLFSESLLAEADGDQALIDECESLESDSQLGFTVDDVSVVQEAADTATVDVSLTYDVPGATSQTVTTELVLEDGDWKIIEMVGGLLPPALPGSEGEGSGDPAAASAGQALAQEFLDVVNGGDADAAIAMLCPGDDPPGHIQGHIDHINDVAGDADLEIDPDTAEISGVLYEVELTGSVHGESILYGYVDAAFEDSCIVNFGAPTS